jgi:hypothetical protein
VRHSLKQSVKDSPVSGFERYPKGSIVICNACAMPIYKLDFGIALGDKGGRSADSFKPLTATDLIALAHRQDVDAGVVAKVKSLTIEDQQAVTGAAVPKSGDPMMCPVCKGTFAQIISIEKHEVLDRAYVIELLTIPPQGQRGAAIRGRHIGAHKAWVHEGAEVIQ